MPPVSCRSFMTAPGVRSCEIDADLVTCLINATNSPSRSHTLSDAVVNHLLVVRFMGPAILLKGNFLMWTLIFLLANGSVFETELRFKSAEACVQTWRSSVREIETSKSIVGMDNFLLSNARCVPVAQEKY